MIRVLLFPLGAPNSPPLAVATFDDGRASVECDDPDLKLRLTTVLGLAADVNRTAEELRKAIPPGSEAHFRAVLSAQAHLGLRAVFDDT